jgi:UDP-N-acetylmuramoylalanine--D-glutamate ligase
MRTADLHGKKIGILGLGVNNAELAAYLVRHGNPVTVRDANPAVREKFEAAHSDEARQVAWELGGGVLDDLDSFDIVFRSPGMPITDPAFAQLPPERISSQTKLFFDLCPARIIGVTGTKGKGTTSTLINRILQAGYTRGAVRLAGNIGVDPFSFLDELGPDDLVVLELSSFQLEDLQASPSVAVLLHITPDHLDHHVSFEEYQGAKLNLIRYQQADDTAILYGGTSESASFAEQTKAHTYLFSRHQEVEQGGWVEGEDGGETAVLAMQAQTVRVPIGGRLLRGEHNLENILPACMVGHLLGVAPETMGEQVRTFTGLPHRLSLVGEYDGIRFYDDSIATTPESCLVAVEAFAGERIHLFAGGNDKGQEYEGIASELLKRCVSITLLPGKATGRLRQALAEAGPSSCTVLGADTPPYFVHALESLKSRLQAGDIVLLAPGAASVDQHFASYVARAEAFASAVTEIFA